MEISPIAEFRGQVSGKFGVPRQSGLAPSLEGEVQLLPPYNRAEALRGLEGFDRIWLIWGFSLNRGNETESPSLTVRPPRLGGNNRVGVFASRSPFRPNGLGLSCVEIQSIDTERCIIRVLGADLADGTPIYDIKPYLPYADAYPGARAGFADSSDWKPLKVVFAGQASASGNFSQNSLLSEGQTGGFPDNSFPPGQTGGFPGNSSQPGLTGGFPDNSSQPGLTGLAGLTISQLKALEEILAQDPRPQYQDDPDREYGLTFAGRNIRFRVRDGVLTVFEVTSA